MLKICTIILAILFHVNTQIAHYYSETKIVELRKKVIFNKRNFHKYEPLIHKLSKKHKIDHKLVIAVVIVESKFNPNAGSRKGALGLMQLMPATARELGVVDRLDPKQNLKGGVKYLKKMLNRFNNNSKLAIAAYNAGPGKVLKYKGIPPYVETQKYVKKVIYIHSLL